MKHLAVAFFLLLALPLYASFEATKKEIEKIDKSFEGRLGVVIRDLEKNTQMEYNAEENWYLSSTVKVLVAISLLEEVQEGRLKLDQKVTLKEEDFVDGAGPVLWSQPGQQFSVKYLLEAMLVESDNTAADLLIGLIGIDEFNRDRKRLLPGSGEFTSLLEVRYLTYSKLHPKARDLNNMDFVILKNSTVEKRPAEFAKKVKISATSLLSKDLAEAHEKFYAEGFNSAPLQSYVLLLEKLAQGKILSGEHTNLVLGHMEKMKTGENRLKAGLPTTVTFIQKTGTQLNRACNAGLIKENTDKQPRYALIVCAQTPSEAVDSDQVFKRIGEVIGKKLI